MEGFGKRYRAQRRLVGVLGAALLAVSVAGCATVASTKAVAVSSAMPSTPYPNPDPDPLGSTCYGLAAQLPSHKTAGLSGCDGALHEGSFTTLRLHVGDQFVVTSGGGAPTAMFEADDPAVVGMARNVGTALRVGTTKVRLTRGDFLCDAPSGLGTALSDCVLMEVSVSAR